MNNESNTNANILMDTFQAIELENALDATIDSVDFLFDDIQSRAAHRELLEGTCFRYLCLDF